VIETAWSALRPAGVLIATCASTNRPVHGATGAPAPAPGEWYENVTPDELSDVLVYLFHRYNIEYRYPPGDAYMWGVK
jgi:hypothetical protein